MTRSKTPSPADGAVEASKVTFLRSRLLRSSNVYIQKAFLFNPITVGSLVMNMQMRYDSSDLFFISIFFFLKLTLPSWLGQERGWQVVAALADSRTLPASGWLHSGSRCNTSIRFVMKKLFCRAATPFSGKIEVCLHTGQDSVKDWGGM